MRLLRWLLPTAVLLGLTALPSLSKAASDGSAQRDWASSAKRSKIPAPAASNACKACLERGVVLDPNLFAQGYEPEVKLGYEAAKKYPDTIDRIHCFCECKENKQEHHKTLLTCFTSPHAAGCGVCLHEAIEAAKMKAQGASDDEVEITVESLHKTDGHPPTFGRGM